MKLINRLERKFGRYAIRNLPAIMIGLYAAGYLLSVFAPDILGYLTLEPYFIIHKLHIWRIITWVIVPPDSLGIFTIIMLFFYFSIGSTLERTWGAFRFNLYILSGVLFTVIGAFLLYALYPSGGQYILFGRLFSTYYINMSIFLAFALTYPDMQVLLYFIIPVKMKWMGILYGILIVVSFYQTNWAGRVAIIASLLNFIVFFFLNSDMKRKAHRMTPQEIMRRQNFKKNVNKAQGNTSGPRHRCTVCGRTEKDDPRLEFRYCSKCDGAYEYCNDHLFNHTHIRVEK